MPLKERHIICADAVWELTFSRHYAVFELCANPVYHSKQVPKRSYVILKASVIHDVLLVPVPVNASPPCCFLPSV